MRYSTQGRAIGEELEAQGADAYADGIERRIAYRIAREIGARDDQVSWRVYYGVAKQGNRKVARRMVEIHTLGGRFLAQKMEPLAGDSFEPWYTVGALRDCAVCGEPMLTLAGSWVPDREGPHGQPILDPHTQPTGATAHLGCGPVSQPRYANDAGLPR